MRSTGDPCPLADHGSHRGEDSRPAFGGSPIMTVFYKVYQDAFCYFFNNQNFVPQIYKSLVIFSSFLAKNQ